MRSPSVSTGMLAASLLSVPQAISSSSSQPSPSTSVSELSPTPSSSVSTDSLGSYGKASSTSCTPSPSESVSNGSHIPSASVSVGMDAGSSGSVPQASSSSLNHPSPSLSRLLNVTSIQYGTSSSMSALGGHATLPEKSFTSM